MPEVKSSLLRVPGAYNLLERQSGQMAGIFLQESALRILRANDGHVDEVCSCRIELRGITCGDFPRELKYG